MYTRCPSCRTTYAITVEQLRTGRGEAFCEHCKIAFDVLDTLAENAEEVVPDHVVGSSPPVLGPKAAMSSFPEERPIVVELPSSELPAILATPNGALLSGYGTWEEAPDLSPASGHHRLIWRFGAGLLLATLVLQIFVFNGTQIAQDERLRPWLDILCEGLHCTLPQFRNVPQIQIVDKALQPASQNGNALEFTLVLTNQAGLPQAFPAIKLVLTDFHNQPVADGVFKPEEYLHEQNTGLMPVGKPFEVRLLLAKPSREVAGFTFELI